MIIDRNNYDNVKVVYGNIRELEGKMERWKKFYTCRRNIKALRKEIRC